MRRCASSSIAQLPPALARLIESRGHAAEHVADRGMTSASDDEIREYAEGVGAVIVTKDEDFAVRRLLTGGPSVVWLRLGNTRLAALRTRFESELPRIIEALERGDTLIEIV